MAEEDATRTALEALIFAGVGPTTLAQLRRALPKLSPSASAYQVLGAAAPSSTWLSQLLSTSSHTSGAPG